MNQRAVEREICVVNLIVVTLFACPSHPGERGGRESSAALRDPATRDLRGPRETARSRRAPYPRLGRLLLDDARYITRQIFDYRYCDCV